MTFIQVGHNAQAVRKDWRSDTCEPERKDRRHGRQIRPDAFVDIDAFLHSEEIAFFSEFSGCHACFLPKQVRKVVDIIDAYFFSDLSD